MNRFFVRVSGRRARFTIPHHRADPYTYPVMTPSAAKGFLRALYWKPQFEWVIEGIHVLNPIQYETVTFSGLNTPELRGDRTLITCTDLVNVAYIVEASIVPNTAFELGDHDYVSEAMSRLRRGQEYRTPHLGLREYECMWELVNPDAVMARLPIDLHIGPMLYDLIPRNVSQDMLEPVFFNAEVRSGVLRPDAQVREAYLREVLPARKIQFQHQKTPPHRRSHVSA